MFRLTDSFFSCGTSRPCDQPTQGFTKILCYSPFKQPNIMVILSVPGCGIHPRCVHRDIGTPKNVHPMICPPYGTSTLLICHHLALSTPSSVTMSVMVAEWYITLFDGVFLSPETSCYELIVDVSFVHNGVNLEVLDASFVHHCWNDMLWLLYLSTIVLFKAKVGFNRRGWRIV